MSQNKVFRAMSTRPKTALAGLSPRPRSHYQTEDITDRRDVPRCQRDAPVEISLHRAVVDIVTTATAQLRHCVGCQPALSSAGCNRLSNPICLRHIAPHRRNGARRAN